MGFDEKDFNNLMRNNIVLKMIEKSYLILSLFVCGNSIVVNVLEKYFLKC